MSGSTTIKIVIMDSELNTIYSNYIRHNSDTKNTLCNMLKDLAENYSSYQFTISITGSGAISAARYLSIPFIQEVISCRNAVQKYIPKTDVAIELGGEDAKIIYFDKFIEQRMNGTCAGGTGAFIDQMASLLNTDAAGLNELAKNYTTIYPIASRCGVFAKTDVQPLLNEGAKKEDVAISILQAVVNQTISGLACGRAIKGNIAFLGGPLNYLSELRARFIESLALTDETAIVLEDSHLLVAKGAAIDSVNNDHISVESLTERIEKYINSEDNSSQALEPLFASKEELEAFKERHAKGTLKKVDISKYEGNCFIGIDAGSTTSKVVVIDEEGNLLYSLYDINKGDPLKSVINMLKKAYSVIPKTATVRYSGITGYGEKLIQTALNIDTSEIETIAHYEAAKKFEPNVSSIIDIGGQDMKYIKIKDNNVDNIMLNEACSSGCGSFIQMLADSLDIPISDFVDYALDSKRPVDLGTRCTVFINSKIKQAQKEGATIGDISAGLSISVVKNALQKVMKIRDTEILGDHIVVQGGTFYNDAVLRSFELVVGKKVIRPEIAGLMGAYGIALLSAERFKELNDYDYTSTLSNEEELKLLKADTAFTRCKACENKCQLTINTFNGNKRIISGNRCERGSGNTEKKNQLPNLYKYRYNKVFNYEPLEERYAARGTIGIPRVLNMYEDYPFWFTFFTSLGFRVELSGTSNRKIYEKGMESMPSESVCYPAKLSHGHIMDLIEKGVKTIFYPCITYTNKEDENSNNTYNCPIVISYPEAIKNNIEELNDITFLNPFLHFNNKGLVKRILELPEFEKYHFSKKELLEAANNAEKEQQAFKNDISNKGKETIRYIEENNVKGIVLAGRPYHIDPEINHGIDTLITSLGLAVLTEDSVSGIKKVKRPLRVVDQWTYHSRMYSAAEYVGMNDNLELIQLNSFGCGVDAVTTDQVEEILASYNKLYTLIKIDEINNLGAIKIRLRSLLASMNKRLAERGCAPCSGEHNRDRVLFTKEMRKEKYTILMPLMIPTHFELLESAINACGYNAKLLNKCTPETVNTGLKYINNDACYPSILTIGQLIEALESGEYDINKTAVVMSQTGGGCRATNYIGFIRKALKDAGFPNVPIISFNLVGLEKSPGFKITLNMLKMIIRTTVYGDLLQKLYNKNRSYEKNIGETKEIYDKWMIKCKEIITAGSGKDFKKSLHEIVEDFEKIELDESISKPKVGVVGEILIKYHPFGNNDVAEFLHNEGAEVVMPDFMGFVKFKVANKIITNNQLKIKPLSAFVAKLLLRLINSIEKDVNKALKKSNKNYLPPCDIWHLEEIVSQVLSSGNQTGEGWFLTAEMIDYIENGIPNIVCVQPFACLPNHIVGKGVIKTIRSLFPNANIAPIDYDPGASNSNQINRLKLFMTIAEENLKYEMKQKTGTHIENEETEEKQEKTNEEDKDKSKVEGKEEIFN
ncbi:MAG: 2-hydroxyacyl-CoA dehydratase [Oscillospiraceae bacterium]|nr:2-hydroxyacyl-CoA dehydratase [Oscillospiraceae bacterium]